MANREHCKKQIARMAGMDYFPGREKPEALKELIDSLERWAVSDAHATRIITEILEDVASKCPTAAVIRSVAWSTRPEEKQQQCGECFNGWIFTQRGEYSGAAPCPACRTALVDREDTPQPSSSLERLTSGKDRAAGGDR